MRDKFPSKRGALIAWAAAVACGLGACTSLAPGGLPPGTPIAKARATLFGPTGEHALPDGGTRLEFAQGSFGKQTYMLDFNADGVLVASSQVLTTANFAAITSGMSSVALKARLGRPVYVFSVPRQKLHVWNYRYFEGDCQWFQVSVDDATQRVSEASYGYDPACDGPNSHD